MALTEVQVVILYLLRIAIVSFNREMSNNPSKIGENYEVNNSSKETEHLFLIVLTWKSEKLCEPVLGCEMPKDITKHQCFVYYPNTAIF